MRQKNSYQKTNYNEVADGSRTIDMLVPGRNNCLKLGKGYSEL